MELKLSTIEHPKTVRQVCAFLGAPIPKRATADKQPSEYMDGRKRKTLHGGYKDIVSALKKGQINFSDKLPQHYMKFKDALRKQSDLNYNPADFEVLFLDWYIFARRQGFAIYNYFQYELYKKEQRDRIPFMGFRDRIKIYRLCTNPDYHHYMMNKVDFYKMFADNVKRKWIDTTTCSFEDFEAFVREHPRFFTKPVEGSGGQNARVIDISGFDDLHELFENLKNGTMLVEELIKQHQSISAFNPDTVNTLRIYTLFCADNIPRIMGAICKFGRKGSAVDNFCAGGYTACVDIETGKIMSDGVNWVQNFSPSHPDTGQQFNGFQYPLWEKVRDTVLEFAAKIPQVRSVGWDVSVTSNGEVEFVEGNSGSDFDALQVPTQTGTRPVYEKYLNEIAEIEGTKYPHPRIIKTKLKKNAGNNYGPILKLMLEVKKLLNK